MVDIRVADSGEGDEAGLLGAEFSFLPAEIVSTASSASVGVGRVSGPTCPTYFEEEPVLLSQLFLHCVGYGHKEPLTSRSFSLSYIIAVGQTYYSVVALMPYKFLEASGCVTMRKDKSQDKKDQK